jgi:hypothetical protein
MIPVGDAIASLVDAGTGLEFSETWYARFYRHNRQAGRWMQPTRGTQLWSGHLSRVVSDERPPGSVRRLCSASISMPVPGIYRHNGRCRDDMQPNWVVVGAGCGVA